MTIVRTQQTQYDNGFGGGTNSPVAYPSALTPGSKLLALASVGANKTVTFSDSLGLAWTTVTQRYWANNGVCIALGWADNPASSSSGVTVTAAWDGTSQVFRSGALAEYTGLATGAADAFTAGNNATGTTPSDVAMTTITDGDLVISAIVTEGQAASAGSGFALITPFQAVSNTTWESQIQAVHGSITPSFVIGATNQCVIVSAAFKPAAGAAVASLLVPRTRRLLPYLAQ